ncbi:hypothetical protein Tam1G_0417 [Bifidobacterium imperatoris]|uniref:Uncharacterized protein n=1 Tax=Bifidobacterium imperatoris TaxID=2020965 RepID=A0A2N5IUE7_9BIFI|nr:hypothetical protein Tam1G_0417 [Bifidobacterium imperatoris]
MTVIRLVRFVDVVNDTPKNSVSAHIYLCNVISCKLALSNKLFLMPLTAVAFSSQATANLIHPSQADFVHAFPERNRPACLNKDQSAQVFELILR